MIKNFLKYNYSYLFYVFELFAYIYIPHILCVCTNHRGQNEASDSLKLEL